MPTSILILGGRSLVAPYLAARLAGLGRRATLASRRTLDFLPAGFSALPLDLEKPEDWHLPAGTLVLSLLPIWVLAAHLDLLRGASGIVAVSSTSRFGKASSDDPHEQEVVRNLTEGEEKLAAWANAQGVPFTILRPTLIYDGKTDQNVTRIIRTIRRFGTFPMAAPAGGLRQPIHADDVAAAIVAAIDNPRAAGRSFNIAGGEVLSYREMVSRIFRELGRKPRPLLLPMGLLKASFKLASKIGLLHERHFGAAVFQRMNEDLVFDVQDGLEALGVTPRNFGL